MSQDILLVGSIPLDTPEAVFRTLGRPLGGALKPMPDGEVGRRGTGSAACIIRCSPAMPS